jgi:hypothetical protein
MLRVGIVAEGPSDWLVLKEVMKAVHPDIEFVHLQPDQTLANRRPNGWKGVRAWCREFGPQLETFMTGVGSPLHLLVIHADCSMAHNEGAEHPCPPAAALRDIILTSWLGRNPRPHFLVVATPSKTIDAWVVATLDPPYANLAAIECDIAAEDELVCRKYLRRRDGEVKKQAAKYQPLAIRVGLQLHDVCNLCPQAAVFRGEFGLAASWAEGTI